MLNLRTPYYRPSPAVRSESDYVDFDLGHSYSGPMARAALRRVKSRLDVLLVERGLMPSRHAARAVLMAGDIKVEGQVVTKPAALVETTAQIEVIRRPAYVSRGGDKLAHALAVFELD